jgi:hypothetical protein
MCCPLIPYVKCPLKYMVSLFTVVSQAYQAMAEALPVARGCTAVLRCVLPSFVREFVRVVSWLQEPSFYIYPSMQGGKSIRIRGGIESPPFCQDLHHWKDHKKDSPTCEI